MLIPHDKLRVRASERAERCAQLLRLAHACHGVCEGSGGAESKGDNARCFAAAVYSATARAVIAAAQGGARRVGLYQAAAVLTPGPACGGCGGLGHWSALGW